MGINAICEGYASNGAKQSVLQAVLADRPPGDERSLSPQSVKSQKIHFPEGIQA